jgi:hypothetical protein
MRRILVLSLRLQFANRSSLIHNNKQFDSQQAQTFCDSFPVLIFFVNHVPFTRLAYNYSSSQPILIFTLHVKTAAARNPAISHLTSRVSYVGYDILSKLFLQHH